MKKMLAFCLLCAAGTAARAVTFGFPAGSSIEHTASFDGTVAQANAAGKGIFTAGDYVQDSLLLAQPITFDSYSFSAPLLNYSLAATEDFDILLNNTLLGTFSVTAQDAAAGTISGMASFAPVTVSGVTTLRVQLTNSLATGRGSVGAGTTGSFTLNGPVTSPVPEPTTWFTMAFGLAVVATAARRSRRAATAA